MALPTVQTSEQLGVPYYTLTGWRRNERRYSTQAYVGSGHKRKSKDPKEQRIYEQEKENRELQRANGILQETLVFFAKNRKKELIYRIPAYRMPMDQVKALVFRYVFVYYNRLRVYTANPGGLPPEAYRLAALRPAA